MAILNTLRYMRSHPLTRDSFGPAVVRFLQWQLGTRLLGQKAVVPWVNNTRLLVGRGDAGLTGNIYTGLHEFSDMAFVLHYLRDTDLFVDVGANAGAYTVLASGAIHCRTIAIEPIPSTFARLLDNVRLNALSDLVACENIGLGAQEGELIFSVEQDSVNHVLGPAEVSVGALKVPVKSLDQVLPRNLRVVLKIDVEGYETPVIDGARELFCAGLVDAVIMELNGSGERYGFCESALARRFSDLGFTAAKYDAFTRTFSSFDLTTKVDSNILFLRDMSEAADRVMSAPKFSVLKTSC